MAGELQALRLAAGERRHRLAEPQVVEADVRQRREAPRDLRVARRRTRALRPRSARARRRCCGPSTFTSSTSARIAPAVAVGAAQVHVGEELHLDVLEAVAAAGRAAAVAGVEAEGARRCSARSFASGAAAKQLADRVERADVARRVGARRAADRRLVDEHDVVDVLGARAARGCAPGVSVGLPWCLRSAGCSTSCTSVDLPEPDTPVMQTRRFSGNVDVDVLQVVLGGAAELSTVP